MTRIVAGTAGGRRIAVPKSFRGRPTAERAREALFASLTVMLGSLDGLAVLDGYAGTGAVGIEALSRGAARSLFVESDRAAARAIGDNLRTLGLAGGTVLARPMEQVAATAPPGRQPFDVVFLDPPYPTPAAEVHDVVAALWDHGWLAAPAVLVVERPSREDAFPWPDRITPDRSRRYGEATLWYGHAQAG
ncbi:MAG: 16S rRNA (guanine(966)-N(2))-methyltransferase RsmD [Streptosporangiales bacterium]|nr:16S rRNA (guanine(966)-N(2))-methyltransferase RsmD [Streptosporangiales bacterium]